MSNFSICFLIFGGCVLLVGLYMYTGHELKIIAWKAAFKGLTIEGWKRVGKYTILASVIIFMIAILGIIFKFE